MFQTGVRLLFAVAFEGRCEEHVSCGGKPCGVCIHIDAGSAASDMVFFAAENKTPFGDAQQLLDNVKVSFVMYCCVSGDRNALN